MENKDLDFLNWEFVGNLILLGAILVGLTLNYDDIKKEKKEKKIYSNEEHQNINLANRVILVLVSIGFFYISYLKYLDLKNKQEKKNAELQVISSLLVLIATIIQLYLSIVNYDSDFII